MIKSALIWFKSLSEAWRTFTVLISFVTLVGGTAVALDHFRSRANTDHDLIKYLQRSDTINSNFRKQVLFRLKTVSDTLSFIHAGQKKITDSYATFVQDHTMSVPEFMKYMNGMEFTVIQSPVPATVNKKIDDVRPDLKIKIIPFKK
jgi:hypothetical protein